jgi:hypothetical protein
VAPHASKALKNLAQAMIGKQRAWAHLVHEGTHHQHVEHLQVAPSLPALQIAHIFPKPAMQHYPPDINQSFHDRIVLSFDQGNVMALSSSLPGIVHDICEQLGCTASRILLTVPVDAAQGHQPLCIQGPCVPVSSKHFLLEITNRCAATMSRCPTMRPKENKSLLGKFLWQW